MFIVCTGHECNYRYTRQPPTELNCNPYDVINRLVLTCSVEGPNTPSFSIIWLRRTDISLRDEELQNSQPRVDIDTAQTIPAQFTRHSSRLTLSELDEIGDVGQYWCQVRLENGTVFQKRSSNLTLRLADSYRLLSRCTGSSVTDNRSCLGVSMQPNVPDVSDVITAATNSSSSSVKWTTFSSDSDNISPIAQTTSSLIEEREDNTVNPVYVLYAIIAIIVASALLVFILLIAIISLRCKQYSTKLQLDKYVIEGDGRYKQEQTDQETSPADQDENFDLKENSAYNKVGKLMLNANVSYVLSIPPRPQAPQE